MKAKFAKNNSPFFNLENLAPKPKEDIKEEEEKGDELKEHSKSLHSTSAKDEEMSKTVKRWDSHGQKEGVKMTTTT